ncbi:phage holin family protein [Hydrocarboniclastica marina]|uniref:Phage holin family protein n=1 Tax=Hydrocarboniclastica marina TaxID=2259620 RepID=A0A4P7XGA5_9ALTE|nr:phage holin family protein [Hydrocarboniclastica marina]MAL99834.1 hypothetical protein [Alteromonadaceae bacterium]QCF25202.1 phage holin family protein [Hydrocarboniclastica marina]|tara:strand:+ start:284 stop:691 length:408 start_codon:yes stop_codon:yes gene_type:complete
MDEQRDPNRSLTSLISELADESSALVRQEVALAKAEAQEKVTQLTNGIKYLVIGGAILIAGLFYILDAVVYGIARLMPEQYQLWLAALIVGVVVGVIGLVLLKKGEKNVQGTNLQPRRTVRSVKLDTQLVKGHSQ